jgi:hypothetical protein
VCRSGERHRPTAGGAFGGLLAAPCRRPPTGVSCGGDASTPPSASFGTVRP